MAVNWRVRVSVYKLPNTTTELMNTYLFVLREKPVWKFKLALKNPAWNNDLKGVTAEHID
jgi:hypothetical protein